MKIVVLQSNYIPWKGYFELISQADVFCFYDEVKYTKNDWRNRNQLIDDNGPFWLTIPISKESVNFKIEEVKITDPSWQKKHYKTIASTYAKAPQFKIVDSILQEIYLNNSWVYLSEMNQYFIEKVARYIGLKTRFVKSGDYQLPDDRVMRLASLVKQVGGTTYISGPAAKDYLTGREHIFADANIELRYATYGPYLPYRQNSPGFTNNVSIIDTLMFIPKESLIDYITSAK